MQTNFTAVQLANSDIREAEKILRSCVHCGFCTATCPTYALLGDELDSPRGRIYLIKDMLENDRPATEDVVKHIDRCLSCLSCMSTCPSGVNYMHLVDHAPAPYRAHLSPPMAGPPIPPSLGLRPASAAPVQGGAQRVALGQTVRSMGAGCVAGYPGFGPVPCAHAFPCRSAAGFRDPDADPARGVAQRLRPAGPGA